MTSCSAIIVAAGEGLRMKSSPPAKERSVAEAMERKRLVRQAGVPKPYIKLRGKPLLLRTLKPFYEVDKIANLVIVTLADWVEYCQSMVTDEFGTRKPVSVIAGGKKRQDSVYEGLKSVQTDIVVIHDSVRPFVTPDFINCLIGECEATGAVIPGLQLTDTVKEADAGFVRRTLAREQIYSIQTPQVFKRGILKKAYQEAYAADFYGTDEASLVERMGVKVKVIPGLKENIKITAPEDLMYAETLLNRQV